MSRIPYGYVHPDALTRMFAGWPTNATTTADTDDAPPVDPRTVIDDEVDALLNSRNEQFRARMWQQLNVRYRMDHNTAHAILTKLGLR